MEDVLSVYQRPYGPKRPVICLDELSKLLHYRVIDKALDQVAFRIWREFESATDLKVFVEQVYRFIY